MITDAALYFHTKQAVAKSATENGKVVDLGVDPSNAGLANELTIKVVAFKDGANHADAITWTFQEAPDNGGSPGSYRTFATFAPQSKDVKKGVIYSVKLPARLGRFLRVTATATANSELTGDGFSAFIVMNDTEWRAYADGLV